MKQHKLLDDAEEGEDNSSFNFISNQPILKSKPFKINEHRLINIQSLKQFEKYLSIIISVLCLGHTRQAISRKNQIIITMPEINLRGQNKEIS